MKIGVIGLMLHPLAPHVFVIFHDASASASGRHETLFQWDFSSHIQSRAAVPLEQRQLQGWRCGCASICAARASYDRATRHSIAASTNTEKKKKPAETVSHEAGFQHNPSVSEHSQSFETVA